MIRLETLHIRKLGNVAPNTELHFGKRGSLLIGRNGTGKTTLLNIIVASLSSNWGYLHSLGNGFELSYSMTVEPSNTPPLRFDVTMKKAPKQEQQSALPDLRELTYPAGHLSIAVLGKDSPLVRVEVDGNLLAWHHPDGGVEELAPAPPANLGIALLAKNKEGESAFEQAEKYVSEIAEKLSGISRLDEALTAFEGLTENNHGPNELAIFQFDSKSRITRVASRALSAALLQGYVEAQRQSPTSDISAGDRSVLLADSSTKPDSWLADFCRFCGIQEAKLYLSFIFASEQEAHYGPLSISYKINGKTLTHYHLSFGQKRLFAALHHFDANPEILVADELVNGMHHRWIGHCVEQLEQRQAFLANQNPLLFDFWPFESVEDVAACFIECRTDEQGRFAWRNMPKTEAHEFYATYLGGIQHVSSILYTRGYW